MTVHVPVRATGYASPFGVPALLSLYYVWGWNGSTCYNHGHAREHNTFRGVGGGGAPENEPRTTRHMYNRLIIKYSHEEFISLRLLMLPVYVSWMTSKQAL